jgi:hypothetical protein
MTNNRSNQQQIWADKEFVDWIMRLKGKLEAQGIRVRNIGDITKKIIKAQSIEDLERQLLQSQNISDIKIKMDSRRFF